MPSIRSGGRKGTDDTVMLPPGGRAFNPVGAQSTHFVQSWDTASTYQRDRHHPVASTSEIDG